MRQPVVQRLTHALAVESSVRPHTGPERCHVSLCQLHPSYQDREAGAAKIARRGTTLGLVAPRTRSAVTTASAANAVKRCHRTLMKRPAASVGSTQFHALRVVCAAD